MKKNCHKDSNGFTEMHKKLMSLLDKINKDGMIFNNYFCIKEMETIINDRPGNSENNYFYSLQAEYIFKCYQISVAANYKIKQEIKTAIQTDIKKLENILCVYQDLKDKYLLISLCIKLIIFFSLTSIIETAYIFLK